MHYLDYNEKQAHGTAGFSLAYYYVDEHHRVTTCPFTGTRRQNCSGSWRDSSGSVWMTGSMW